MALREFFVCVLEKHYIATSACHSSHVYSFMSVFPQSYNVVMLPITSF